MYLISFLYLGLISASKSEYIPVETVHGDVLHSLQAGPVLVQCLSKTKILKIEENYKIFLIKTEYLYVIFYLIFFHLVFFNETFKKKIKSKTNANC